MLRFALGFASGWIAARSLPSGDADPWSLPTTVEITILADRAKSALLKLRKMLEEEEND